MKFDVSFWIEIWVIHAPLRGAGVGVVAVTPGSAAAAAAPGANDILPLPRRGQRIQRELLIADLSDEDAENVVVVEGELFAQGAHGELAPEACGLILLLLGQAFLDVVGLGEVASAGLAGAEDLPGMRVWHEAQGLVGHG